jgi:hydrogenase maturation protease
MAKLWITLFGDNPDKNHEQQRPGPQNPGRCCLERSMTPNTTRCLILACGNTLRGDDGVGPWLAEWAEERFRAQAGVRILCRQQWTPELAEEVARTTSVVFLDCSVDSEAGVVGMAPVEAVNFSPAMITHHLGAAELLGLGLEFYASLPRQAFLLTVGAGSTELGEQFSDAVKTALPEACKLIEETVLRLLELPQKPEQP